MKGLRMITLMFMLSLIFACLISSPVLSGSGDENPWDADNDGEEGILPPDTVNVGNNDLALTSFNSLDEVPNPWLDNFYLAAKIQFSLWIGGDKGLTTPTVGK